MKKARPRQKPGLDRKAKPPPAASGEVTLNGVIENLFSLFEHMGMEVPRPRFDPSGTDSHCAHPLYPHASAISELLTSWHQDPGYLDDHGNPSPIKLRGKRPSFHSLAQRTVPKLDKTYLFSELERLGAVSMDGDHLICVHTRSFPAYGDKRLAIQYTLTTLDGFIKTLRHNLDGTPSNSDQLFHRIARNDNFDSREIAALKIRAKRHGQSFLESFDNWLARKTLPKSRTPGRRTGRANVSIGVYLSIEKNGE